MLGREAESTRTHAPLLHLRTLTPDYMSIGQHQTDIHVDGPYRQLNYLFIELKFGSILDLKSCLSTIKQSLTHCIIPDQNTEDTTPTHLGIILDGQVVADGLVVEQISDLLGAHLQVAGPDRERVFGHLVRVLL